MGNVINSVSMASVGVNVALSASMASLWGMVNTL